MTPQEIIDRLREREIRFMRCDWHESAAIVAAAAEYIEAAEGAKLLAAMRDEEPE